MKSLEIYVERESIENEFSVFLNNDKKIIWSIHGVGGIGKTTLLNRFFNSTKENDHTACFFDYANHATNKISGLDILLYNLATNNCKTFEKLKRIIRKKYTSISQHLDRLGETAGSIPLQNINSLIVELDKDAEYTKELGLVWATIIDTIKVGAKLFNREKKDEIISSNPELHLVSALLADMEKNSKSVILVDTFEKYKEMTVSTTLHLIGGELTSSNEVYELSFEHYLALILKFLYEKREKADIKTIIAGRARLNKIADYNLIYIKQTEVNKFEPEQIVDYFNKVKEYLPNFPIPNDDIASDIQKITNGNPLILEYLIQFIIDRYEDEWTWNDWNELKEEFKNSDDEYGLVYYLTDRIATHISGWKNSMWKLTIPLKLSPDIAEILYPKQEDGQIYGKEYFELLHEKGIMRRGDRLDKKNFYLLDELQSSLDAYIKKEFGKNGKIWYDDDQVIKLHDDLQKHYSTMARWDEYPKEYTGDFLASSNESGTMNKQELYFASYHAFASKQYFERELAYLGKNRFEYWSMMVQSFFTTHAFTYWIAENMNNLSEAQLKSLISLIVIETNEYQKFYSIEFNGYLKELKTKSKFPHNWQEDEYFIQDSLATFPNEPGLHFTYALFQDKIKKDKEKAITCYQKATYIKPDYYAAFSNMGVAYFDLCEYEKAIECYQKAIEIKPDYHEAFNNMGLAYHDKGDKKKAIECYQKAIEIKPESHDAFNNMGLAYRDKDDEDKAIECYQKAIEIKIDKYEAYNNLGNIYSNKGNKEKAIECYQKAIEIKPDDHNAFTQMGLTYFEKCDYDKAIECYQMALDIKPDNHDAFSNMGVAYHSKCDYDKAIECYQMAIEIKPDKHGAYTNMGLAYHSKCDYNKAIECYHKSIQIKPDSHDALYNMGLAYDYKGDKDKALEFYNQAIEIKPDLHNAFYNMGLVYSKKGDYEKAIECYHKAIEIKPDDHKGFYNMGNAYDDKGDYDKAIECFQKAVEIKPNKHVAFHNMGIAYSNKGDYNKVIECYQKAIEIKPDDHEANMSIGFTYLKLGDIKLAEEYLTKSVELGSVDFGNMNLGHVFFAKQNEKSALKTLKAKKSFLKVLMMIINIWCNTGYYGSKSATEFGVNSAR